MDIKNVLIFPAGTEVGLEIYDALKNIKDIKLFAAGMAIDNHAEFLFSYYHAIPSIFEDGWIESLNSLCHDLSIDYIFPAYDDVIVALALNREKINTTVLAPSQLTCEITRSKSLTYKALASLIPTPMLYSLEEANQFPLFVKPDRGQGSQGAKLVQNATQLKNALAEVQGGIICEYLPGEEYTVDCFTDRVKGTLFSQARTRQRIRNGISVRSEMVKLDSIQQTAQAIAEKLNLHGAWFFQVKRGSDSTLKLLEVAPRIAGSMCLHRMAGVNFPLLTIYEADRRKIDILLNTDIISTDRALQSRYKSQHIYSHLYIDLDDTILINNQINLEAIQLIYSCINKKIPVNLITKHRGNLEETLENNKIAHLFSSVYHLESQQSKYKYIKERDAILIDDSFSERMEASQQLGINTYDCSMLSLLIDQNRI